MKKYVLIAIALFGLTGCEHEYSVRCNYIDEKDVNKIHVGKSNKDDVTRLLGTPFLHMSKNEWLYICRYESRTPFHKPQVEKRVNYKVSFDEKGYVKSVENIQLQEKNVQFDKDYTSVNS